MVYIQKYRYIGYDRIESCGLSDKRKLEIILETLRKDVRKKAFEDLALTDLRDKIPDEIWHDVFDEL